MNPDWALVGRGCKKCFGFGTLGEIVKLRTLAGYAVREIECPKCKGSGRKGGD